MRGNVTKRGRNSWRLKLDIGRDATGKRLTRFVTVRGTKAKAQAELARLVAAFDDGTLVSSLPRRRSPTTCAPGTIRRPP
jgi:hypothetical protein